MRTQARPSQPMSKRALGPAAEASQSEHGQSSSSGPASKSLNKSEQQLPIHLGECFEQLDRAVCFGAVARMRRDGLFDRLSPSVVQEGLVEAQADQGRAAPVARPGFA